MALGGHSGIPSRVLESRRPPAGAAPRTGCTPHGACTPQGLAPRRGPHPAGARTPQGPEKHDWSMLMNASLRPQSTDDFCLLINGKLVPGASTMNVINPATEEVVAACPRADLNQLNEAVAAAKAAFATWKNVPLAKRRQLVLKLADGLESRTAEIAHLLTQEQGKPLGFSMWEVGEACRIIRTFAAMELKDEVLRDTPEVKIVRQRAPLGVVAAIT